MSETKFELAVVIITKNQAWNIRRLLESVLRETKNITSTEIVLIDSASTDDTVEIASKYPVSIFQLEREQILTPAMGRYVGYNNTSGEFILFLDGDMELCPFWLKSALSELRENEQVAIITGNRVDLPLNTMLENEPEIRDQQITTYTEINYCGGASLCKRSILAMVGQFNPFLFSDEEPDLCIRLRYAGFRIYKLNRTIVYHYTDPKVSLKTKTDRWKRNLFLGSGQNLRYHLGKATFKMYLRERGYGLIPLVGGLAGLFFLSIYLVGGQLVWFNVWLISLLIFIIVDVIRKRSLYKTLVSLLERIFIIDGTLRGFFLSSTIPQDYQVDYKTVKSIKADKVTQISNRELKTN